MLEPFFQDIQAHGFSSLDNLIDQHTVRKLVKWSDILRAENQFVPAKVSGEKILNAQIRGDSTYWLDPLHPTVEWGELKLFLDQLQSQLNEKFFLGIKQYECHLAYYPVGAFYKKHLDRLSTNSSRLFTFILYLNENWNEGDGGELVVFDKQGLEIKRLSPQAGRLVGFMSDEFPHEVLPSIRPRLSFTGWMHNKLLY
ncbi:MAG: 2OG-Fe(II) oxygenase [Bacteriovoracaceae bacterium]